MWPDLPEPNLLEATVVMSQTLWTASQASQTNKAKGARTASWERLGILYVRIALGSAFLSPVADRFGLWGKYASWGDFASFTRYVAQVNSFMPAFTIPFGIDFVRGAAFRDQRLESTCDRFPQDPR